MLGKAEPKSENNSSGKSLSGKSFSAVDPISNVVEGERSIDGFVCRNFLENRKSICEKNFILPPARKKVAYLFKSEKKNALN